MSRVERTQVGIVGAGPAGLLLGRLLEQHGIDNMILEARSREYCEARIRAGVLEQSTREALIEAAVGARMEREGIIRRAIYLHFDGESHLIPLSELTGGQILTFYGQTEIVKDLIAARLGTGAPLRFGCEEVRPEITGGPAICYRHDGEDRELRCELIAGCDGFHGVCRRTIPSNARREWERSYPFAWLGVLADVPPPTNELIYARHDEGFALQSMRSPAVSRLYVQVPPEEDVASWSDERFWDAFETRMAAEDWTPNRGPIREKGITPMRSFVAAPMRHGPLFLAGDAAHIVPPTGAKGLNLAVADVHALADALIGYFSERSETGLNEYSSRSLKRVWRAQHFSWWMTQMLHTDPHDDAYGAELARSQLQYVTSSHAAMQSLAENYVGLPLHHNGAGG